MLNLLFLFIGFLLIFSLLRNRDKLLPFLLFFFTVIVFIFSLLGILNFLVNTVSRSYAILGDRVFDSEFLTALIIFPGFLSVFYKSKKPFLMYFLLVVNVVSYVYLFTLRTRAGWVAASVEIVTMVLFLWKYQKTSFVFNKSILKIGVIIVLSIILASVIPFKKENDRSDLLKTIESIFNVSYYSNQARISFWEASIKMFANNPISGIGAGKWAGIYPFYSGESYTDENVDMNSAINPHNNYIEVLTEFGIFGFIIFVGFIFTGLYFLFKKSRNEIAYLPFFLSALGICVTMFFSFTKDNFVAMMVFSICMAVGYSSNSEFEIQNSEFYKKHKRHIRTLFLVIGVLMLCTGLWFKVMSYLNQREYLEAMQLKAQGKYEEMLMKLDGVSDYLYPVDMNKMPVDYYRGVGYFELKQFDKALEKFRNARESMKYYPTVMNNEASALYMTGNFKEAEDRYLEIKKLFPNYIEPQINLLSLYTNLNKITEAKNILNEIEKKPFDGKYVKNYSVFLGIKNYLTDKQR